MTNAASRHLDEKFVEFAGEDASRDAALSCLVCDAAARADLAELRQLLSTGTSADAADYDKRTPLHLVCSQPQASLSVARFLVDECKANPNPVDRWGYSPLDDAVRSGHAQLEEYLRNKGAREGPAVSAKLADSTDLCYAAADGNLTRLRRLLAKGANVNDGDYDKRRAVHIAASEGQLEAMRYLCEEAGAYHSPVDRFGRTPLTIAIDKDYAELVDFLTSIGATEAPAVEYRAYVAESSSVCAVNTAVAAAGAEAVVAATEAAVKAIETADAPSEMTGAKSESLECAERTETKSADAPVSSIRVAQFAEAQGASAVSTSQGTSPAASMKQVSTSPMNLPLVALPGDGLLCPLSGCRFNDPVVAADGFTFERTHIEQWLNTYGCRSPITGEEIPSAQLLPNRSMASLVIGAAVLPPQHTTPWPLKCSCTTIGKDVCLIL